MADFSNIKEMLQFDDKAIVLNNDLKPEYVIMKYSLYKKMVSGKDVDKLLKNQDEVERVNQDILKSQLAQSEFGEVIFDDNIVNLGKNNDNADEEYYFEPLD